MSEAPRHVGLSMDELSELDAAERARIHKRNIDEVRRCLQRRRAAGARCDAVERHLAWLESARQVRPRQRTQQGEALFEGIGGVDAREESR